ncbi:hypothetical protein BHE74_00020002 [Ensete ventricosum]|nr:hypothetical protein BHE74_00020002 [Ensete ventricosum]
MFLAYIIYLNVKFSGPSLFGVNTSKGLENGAIHGQKSAVRAPFNPIIEATFHGISSSMPKNLPTPIRIASVGNSQAAHPDITNSLGKMNFEFQDMPGFHPRSLPDYHNEVNNDIPYNSSTMSAMGIGVISRPVEGIDKRHLQKVGSASFNGHAIDHNEGMYNEPLFSFSALFIWLEITSYAKTLYPMQSFNGKKWEKFNSEKVASLAYARIQGKAALIAHFQNSSLMNEDKRCRPILFHTDGPNAGDQV